VQIPDSISIVWLTIGSNTDRPRIEARSSEPWGGSGEGCRPLQDGGPGVLPPVIFFQFETQFGAIWCIFVISNLILIWDHIFITRKHMYQISIISGTRWLCPRRTCFTKPTVKLSVASEIAVHLQRTHLGRPCISQAEIPFELSVLIE